MQIGFFGLLGLVFITLKLTGFIDWSWLWVLAPFWVGFAIVGTIFIAWGILSASGKGRIVMRKKK